MNHLEMWDLERAWEMGDASWNRYVTAIERIIGRPLDGDEGDGLSLDGAYKAMREGLDPQTYVGVTRSIRPTG